MLDYSPLSVPCVPIPAFMREAVKGNSGVFVNAAHVGNREEPAAGDLIVRSAERSQ